MRVEIPINFSYQIKDGIRFIYQFTLLQLSFVKNYAPKFLPFLRTYFSDKKEEAQKQAYQIPSFGSLLKSNNNFKFKNAKHSDDIETILRERIKKINVKPQLYGHPKNWITGRVTPRYTGFYSINKVSNVYATNLGRVFNTSNQSLPTLWVRRDFRWKHKIDNTLDGVKICMDGPDAEIIPAHKKIIIATQSNSSIYGHFLIEILPRVELVKGLTEEGYYLYTGIDYPVYAEALQLLGIKNKQITDARKHPVIFVEKAVIPLFCLGGNRCFPDFAVNALQKIRTSALASTSFNLGSRLFVKRSNQHSRSILNNEDVENFLKLYGFVAVSPEKYSFVNQVSLFNHADIVVGEHGSAMLNCVFCKKGTKVFDLLPRCVNTTLFRLMYAFGISYFAVQSPDGSKVRWSMTSSFKVNIEYLEYALEENGIKKQAGFKSKVRPDKSSA